MTRFHASSNMVSKLCMRAPAASGTSCIQLEKIFGKSARAICAQALNLGFIRTCYAGGNCEIKIANGDVLNGTGECDVLSPSHDLLAGAGAGAAADRQDHR
jgi:hypothetical protein